MPLIIVADTWLDFPLSPYHTPPILHQPHKQAATQLKSSPSLQSKFLSLLLCGSVPPHADVTSGGSLVLQPDTSSS